MPRTRTSQYLEEVKNIIKCNEEGLIEKAIGGTNSSHQFTGIKYTKDGGFVATGYFFGEFIIREEFTVDNSVIELGSAGDQDAFIIKYNNEGLIE